MATIPSPAAVRPRRRPPFAALGLLLLLGAFAAGVIHLFRLRFEIGDVYPPYSSLRGDPLGTKVLYESLRAIPGLEVSRSLHPLPLIGVPPLSREADDHGEAHFACLYLGADPEEWPYLLPKEGVRRLERIAERGGRIIVTFQPTSHAPTSAALSHSRDAHAVPDPKTKKKTPRPWPSSVATDGRPDLSNSWDVDFRRDKDQTRTGEAAVARGSEALPARGRLGAAVPWHSAVDFQLDTPAARRAGWQAVYDRGGAPVIVERPFGSAGGELILVSDSYFLSNEGLRETASADVLTGLVGPARTILFDESHFGIREHPGLMTLARRYRLQGALATIGLLAALFVWRSTVGLVPPRPADGPGEAGTSVTGRETAAGFLNLLRRGVSPRALPGLCLAQWRQHLAPGSGGIAAEVRQRATPENVARLEGVLAAGAVGAHKPAERRAPAVLYREMCARLRQPRA